MTCNRFLFSTHLFTFHTIQGIDLLKIYFYSRGNRHLYSVDVPPISIQVNDFHFDTRTSINAVALPQNGILALSGSDDGTARLWNTDIGDCIQCFDSKLRYQYSWHPVPVTSVGFVVKGQFSRTVLTGNGDGSIMLWSMEDG